MFLQFIDRLDADRQPLFLLGLPVSGGLQSFNDGGGYLELRILLRERFRFLGALQGKDPGQNRRLAGDAGLLGRIEPEPEFLDIEHGMGLDKIRSGFDLLRQPDDAQLHGFQAGVGDGADGHRKGTVDLLTVQELSLSRIFLTRATNCVESRS